MLTEYYAVLKFLLIIGWVLDRNQTGSDIPTHAGSEDKTG